MKIPQFDRALIVVRPHGALIAAGRKRALVKSKNYAMSGLRLLVVEAKQALAIVIVGEPREINLAEFRAARGRHLVSEAERRRWWSGKRRFFLYPVESIRRLAQPHAVEYPNGAQVFVKSANLKFVRANKHNSDT